jgi:hypothetical protein
VIPDLWFSYLKHLDIPQKLTISHKIVELLIQSDLDIVENSEVLNYNDILDHRELTPEQSELEQVIKGLASKETAFQVAQIEYENKEERFVNLTYYNRHLLDQKYAEMNMLLRDIKQDTITKAIDTRDIGKIIDVLKEAMVIISRDVDISYRRREFLSTLWTEVSEELLELIRSFEYRGLKVVSSNLRVKLKPTLEEYKQELKEPKLIENSLSRRDIDQSIKEMVEQAREDIYGDLTQSQIDLLNEISTELTAEELTQILRTDQIREDLLVLLQTEKIDIKMKKVIDRLI